MYVLYVFVTGQLVVEDEEDPGESGSIWYNFQPSTQFLPQNQSSPIHLHNSASLEYISQLTT